MCCVCAVCVRACVLVCVFVCACVRACVRVCMCKYCYDINVTKHDPLKELCGKRTCRPQMLADLQNQSYYSNVLSSELC